MARRMESDMYPSADTDKARQDAMRSLYGLPPNAPPQGVMTPNNLSDFTFEERQRLRRMLDQEDAKYASGTREFDLNKPPVPPYVYQEYPFLLYHHPTGKTAAARNHQEKQTMLAAGWSIDPRTPDTIDAEPLTAAEEEAAARIDRKLEKKKPA